MNRERDRALRADRARHSKKRDSRGLQRNTTNCDDQAILSPYRVHERVSVRVYCLHLKDSSVCLFMPILCSSPSRASARRWCAALDTFTAISTPRLLLYASGPTSDSPQVLHVCQTADMCGRALGRSPANRIERLGQDQSGPGSLCV
jgi:hypothetical protein